MKPDGIADDPGSVKHSLQVLDDDENERHQERVPPIPPLKRGDENCGHPADNDADVRNHGQNDDEDADERRKVKTDDRESGSDEDAVDETDEQLPAKIGDDVII